LSRAGRLICLTACLLSLGNSATGEDRLVLGEKSVFEFPLEKQELRWLKSSGMTQYKSAEVSIAVPEDFDPDKTYPVLITCVTGDRSASNTKEMDKYWPQAIREGWVVVTGWAQPRPRFDKLLFRRAVTVAAMRALREQVPGSKDWPVAVGWFSGGSKNTAFIAAYLQVEGYPVIGMFMAGCNQDHTGDALRKTSPDKEAYRRIPVFLSTGESDRVSTVAQSKAVGASIKKRGFLNVRFETYPGKHVLNREHVPVALNWFSSLHEAGKN
jgi:hypothetical protein